MAELLLPNVILCFIKLHTHFKSLSWNIRAHRKKLRLILHWVMYKPATPASSTFLTFPRNPQWLLSDGKEHISVFHASLCGSIRVCEGNPHPGRRACSHRQLELIYPPYERSRAFGSSVAGLLLGFVLQWHLQKQMEPVV